MFSYFTYKLHTDTMGLWQTKREFISIIKQELHKKKFKCVFWSILFRVIKRERTINGTKLTVLKDGGSKDKREIGSK